MNSRKNIAATVLLVVSVSLISTMLSSILSARHYGRVQFQTLGRYFQALVEDNALHREALMKTLKEDRENPVKTDGENFLEGLGYRAADFTDTGFEFGYLTAPLCLAAAISLFLSAFLYWHYTQRRQIQMLTQYLEKVNTGGQGLLLSAEENDYSRLQDEIYKTVTSLYQTRDSALKAKNDFADNLYNIAHQLKTPITAIFLSAQMIEEKCDSKYARQIQMQAARLSHLEEALLLLSRIDSGVLTLKRTKTDVFTLLTLAADHLRELSAHLNVAIDIPETGAADFTVDPEWTMDAVINLLKNCMEHSPAGSAVHCSYEKNPLYVQIRIWDEGEGFDREDIPHLFERFYRGKNAAKGGIGIGLSLSRAVIEMQNGAVSAGNLPEGGAFFEIRMYGH